MEIQQMNYETKGFFKAVEAGKEAGLMTYSWAGTVRMIIDHTEINPEFKGMKVGNQLVMAAVEYTREKQIKIIPLCPFAKKGVDKNPQNRGVL